jgi:hypothetical protein
MELLVLNNTIKLTIDTIIAVSALIVSVIALGISVYFWRRSFRPIVTAMVKTHAAGNLGTIFDLEIVNTGSIPAKNIRLKAEQKDIDNALGKDSNTENKIRWLSCFEPKNIISILHNNSSIKCSFGQSKANDQGFWKYKAKIPIKIEYEGWFGKKYIQNQDIQILDSDSFTGYQWS